MNDPELGSRVFEGAGNAIQCGRKLAGVILVAALLLLPACDNGDAGSDRKPNQIPQPTRQQSTAVTDTATSEPAEPSSTPVIRPTSEINPTVTPVPEAVTLVIERTAADYGISTLEVVLLAYESATWSSTALGCPEQGRSYPQIVTSGYEVMMSLPGELALYHVDESGSTIVECEGARSGL